MSKLDQSHLLRFLHKPRFLHEVAEHFQISQRLATLHLREAIKSGQVQSSKKPVFQTSRTPKGKLKRTGGFLYVSSNNSSVENNRTKLRIKPPNTLTSKSNHDFTFTQSSSKASTSFGKEPLSSGLRGFRMEKAEDTGAASVHFKTSNPITSEFTVPSAKVRTVNRRTPEYMLAHGVAPPKEESGFLSNVEKLRLLRTLLKSSTFLDIRESFTVSKDTIRSLVNSGLLEEVWGPKGVGVRFKLTKKGKTYLKKLEATAKIKPLGRETSLVKLKSRVSI